MAKQIREKMPSKMNRVIFIRRGFLNVDLMKNFEEKSLDAIYAANVFNFLTEDVVKIAFCQLMLL